MFCFLIEHGAKVAGFFCWKEFSVAVVLRGNLSCSPRKSLLPLFGTCDPENDHKDDTYQAYI